MGEREPGKETIGRGELLYLWHPGTTRIFSGYGLTTEPDSTESLVGLLMIDRPRPADPLWLQDVEAVFGDYQLAAMTATGDRGIACQMQIEPDSFPHLRRFPGPMATAVQAALQPLLENLPKPIFRLRWDEQEHAWTSQFALPTELPEAVRAVFERTGYGCLAAETNIGVVHVCHAADGDIEGFADKPISYQWQLVRMPTAPLIRLEVAILDDPSNPYRFESFLNVAQEDQSRVGVQLANQERLYLAFHGDDLGHRFTKVIDHDRQQWQYLDELMSQAMAHWEAIPPDQRDYDRAKEEFMKRSG
jgi:hypothetical protein